MPRSGFTDFLAVEEYTGRALLGNGDAGRSKSDGLGPLLPAESAVGRVVGARAVVCGRGWVPVARFGDFDQPARGSLPIGFDGRGRRFARSSELDPNGIENRSGWVA